MTKAEKELIEAAVKWHEIPLNVPLTRSVMAWQVLVRAVRRVVKERRKGK
jgi:hypothetical protein